MIRWPLSNMKSKLLFALVFIFESNGVYAEIFAPTPDGTNQQHWDNLLGSGSFDEYAWTLRLIPIVLLFFTSAWAVVGLFRAAFVDENIKKFDFVLWAGRLMLILTISIALLASKS